MKTPILKNAIVNASLAAAYIVAVSFVMFNSSKFFGGFENTIFVPILMLCLLVFSVALMGALIFGRPVMWYIDGKKKEAVSLLLCTLGVFFLFIIVIFVVLSVVQPNLPFHL
ncbi:MAG: hypothetical protein WC565_00270 [Parcubacteria group bacterium]